MTDTGLQQRSFGPTLAETGLGWLHRIIAAYCLLFGVLYWVRLIGVYDGPLWRFDLMPVHWRIAASVLSVFFPFAAIGLWMLTSWGPVIWFICAAVETTMYLGFPDLFGGRPLVVVCHGMAALLFIAFRVVIHIRSRPPKPAREQG